MKRNTAKRKQGNCASCSQGWKKAVKKNTRKKSRQMAKSFINKEF